MDGNVGQVGLTNDIDIYDLSAEALYVDQPISTKGRWKMNQVFVRGENFLQTYEGSINGFPISRLIHPANSDSGLFSVSILFKFLN